MMDLIVTAFLIKDCKARIADWLISGGTMQDPYVQKQLKLIDEIQSQLNDPKS